MRKKMISILLSMALLVTSADFTVLATEQKMDTEVVTETQVAEESEEEAEGTQSSQDLKTEEHESREDTDTAAESKADETEERESGEGTNTAVESKADETEKEVEERTQTQESVVEEESGSETESETSSDNESEEMPEDVKADGEVSRVEWIQKLVDAFDMTVEEDNYPDNYYNDIDSKDDYYRDIMIAVEFGVIDLEAGESFEPEADATREFAAVTLNHCLGFRFEEDVEYTYVEADDVNNPWDIQVAVNRGWFALTSDREFLPMRAITSSEASTMLKDAKTLQLSTDLTEDHENKCSVAAGVIVVPEGTDVSVDSDGIVTIQDCPVTISAGSLFVVYVNAFPIAYKAISVSTEGSNTLIKTTQEGTEKAFTDIDWEGSYEVDLSLFEADQGASYRIDDVSIVEGATAYGIDYDAKKKVLTASKKITIGNGVSSTVTCKISNLYVEHKMKIGNTFVKLYGDVELSDNIRFDALEHIDVPRTFELGTIPIAGVGKITVAMEYNLSGEITVSLTGDLCAGFSYTFDDGFRVIHNFTKKDFSLSLEATVMAGVKVALEVDLLLVKGTIYARVGAKGEFWLRHYDSGTPKTCVTLSGYLYASAGADVIVTVGVNQKKYFGKSVDFFTKNNSPIRVSYHYEDDVMVSRCTRGDSKTSYYTKGTSKYFNPSGKYGSGSYFSGSGEVIEIYTYTLDDEKHATITGYKGNASALSIPSMLDGNKVTKIGDRAFEGMPILRTVRIADSVTEIGSGAFEDCINLSSVVLSKGLTEMDNSAFRNCDALTTIEIPKSLKSVTNWAYYMNGVFCECDNLKEVTFEKGTTKIVNSLFENCSGIEEIKIPDTVTTIEAYAFSNCTNLKEIKIPNSVTKIDTCAFQNCTMLAKVVMSNSLVEIGNRAFSECESLTEVVIADSVTKIGSGAFQNCINLSSVALSKGLTEMDNSAFRNCDALTTIEIPKNLKSVTNWAYYMNGVFCECDNLKKVTFEKGTTKIVNHLFENCPGIEEIEIPDTVTTIEYAAFQNCENLKKIKIFEFVTEIDDRAFSGCKRLTEVVIPDSVTRIGSGAFENCTNLSSVVLSKGLTEMDNSAFRNCDALTTIEIPKSLKSVTNWLYYMNGVFCECDNLKEVTFEKGTTKIVNSLFENCPGIEEIEIPNTVTTIEYAAFQNCENLKKIKISEFVTEIDDRAFNGCKSLMEVVILDSLTEIGDSAFKDCISLTEITIPDSVTSMGTYIFSGCSNLKEAKLPNIRIDITKGTFNNCSSLEKVNFPETLEYIRSYAFYNTKLSVAVLPKKLIGIESYAFYNCDNLTKVELKNNITSIGTYAFYDCDALTSISIPDSVTSLGTYIFAECELLENVELGTGLTKIPTYAFNLCPSLQKIVIPYRVTTIESNAFTNCTKLTEVTIPRAVTSIAGSVFSYPDRLTIYGISGTYAETYANQIGAAFVNKEVNATEVTLSDTTLSMIAGAKHTLVMSITPSDFTDEVVWKSSDTNILTVDNMGVITAKAVGTANVRVAVGEKTASCTVTVVQPVTYISLDKYRLSLEAFEEYTLTATVSPSDAADKSIEWTSSDETVATVSQTGKITPLAKGSTVIKATAKDGSGKYAACDVTVLSDGQLCTKYNDMESAHNYVNNTNKIWKYVYSGAKTLDITFDSNTNVDDGFDFIYIYDKDNKEIKKATGAELANQTIRVAGDTVKIKLVSDEAVTAWGFKISKVSVDGKIIDSGEEVPREPESSTEEASTEGNSEEESSEEESSVEGGSREEESSTEEGSTEEKSETDETEESISDGFCITGLKTKTYTGSAIKQDIKVYYNKHLIQEGTDYTLSYKDNKNVGKAFVTIKLKGNLTGAVTKTFQIQARRISDTNVIIEDAVYNYDKKMHKKAPTITYNGKNLKEGKDYEITDYGSGDYTSIGTYTVKVKGIGNFTGSFDNAKVIIADKDKNLSKAKIAKIPIQEYQNGAAVVLADNLISVELNKSVLKKDIDYTISYANNTSAGKATLIVKGKGSYAGTKKMNFVIKRTPVALSEGMVKNRASFNSVEIVKGGAKPEPVLEENGETLVKGTDYTLSYKNNKAAGANASIVIKGKGSFKGSITIPFSITTKSLASSTLSVRVPNMPYTGKANTYQSKPVIMDSDGCALAENKDYVLEGYSAGGEVLDKTSNPQEGTEITVVISGKGSYTGKTTATYALRGMKFSSANIKVQSKTYTGDEIELTENDIASADIKLNGVLQPLRFGKDYDIAAYKNNTKKGTASVTFRGLGNYAGEKTVKFKINSGNISN